MDENKNFDEMEENTQGEAAENAAEEITEAAEEAAEEVTEAIGEAAEVAAEAQAVPAYEMAEEPEQIKKGSKIGVIIAVIAAVIVIAIAVITSTMETNKYNKMGYVDVSGKTVQDLADQQEVDLKTFLETYGLPEDMPADTTESAAYYSIPVKNVAQMYGMDFAMLKETLHFPDEITEDSTWGEAEGEVTIADYIGEDNLDAFKAQYGFGDEVTLETKWKEVRTAVDTQAKKQREEQEAAAKEAEKNSEAAPYEEAAPADGEAAPETAE